MLNQFKYGEVKISNDALNDIVENAVLETKGVYQPNEDEAKSASGKSIVKVDTKVLNEKVYVEIETSLKVGANVQKTSQKIQENVKRQLESMTGLTVSNVNVVVNKLFA